MWLSSQAFVSPTFYRCKFPGNRARKHRLRASDFYLNIQIGRKVLPRMSSEQDPIERQVRSELAAEGVNLDELLNGGKVVSLARKLDKLQKESELLQKSSENYEVVEKKIEKLRTQMTREKRQVMQAWLKQIFVFQAVVFLAAGGLLSFDAVPAYHVPLVGQAFGFWMTWLFTIPSLRARKGTTKEEKSALNISFLVIPLLNVCLPAYTRNCGLIWTADALVLAGFYAYYFKRASANPEEQTQGLPKGQRMIKGILKYLDWGSWR